MQAKNRGLPVVRTPGSKEAVRRHPQHSDASHLDLGFSDLVSRAQDSHGLSSEVLQNGVTNFDGGPTVPRNAPTTFNMDRSTPSSCLMGPRWH